MPKTLITRAKIVNEGTVSDQDILIDGQYIKRIADSIPPTEDMEVIDAKGAFLLPGVIDDHERISKKSC